MSAATALTTGHYALVTARCAVRFTARGFGLAVRGEMPVRSGEVRVDGAVTTVDAVLDATGFHTSSARRDRDVRSARFLDVDRFPDLRVTGTWDGTDAPLRGTLTVRDVAAPVELEIVDVDPGGATVRARARVDRRAYAAGPVRGPVGRWVDVELEVALQAV